MKIRTGKIVSLYLFLAVFSTAVFSAPPTTDNEDSGDWLDRFPFINKKVPFFHAYESVRVEQHPQGFEKALDNVHYLKKMRKMMKHSSVEVQEHFANLNTLGPDALSLAEHYYGEDDDSCILGAVGDIMYINKGTKNFITKELFGKLNSTDFLFGNLETPSDPSSKISMVYKLGLRFNCSTALLDTLATGGTAGFLQPSDARSQEPLFDVLSVANNHAFDRGEQGLRATMLEIAARGMTPVGASTCSSNDNSGRYTIVNRKGFSIGTTAFTWGFNHATIKNTDSSQVNSIPFGNNNFVPDLSELLSIQRKMREEGAEFVIVSLHWGYEYEFYPEPHFMKIARILAANGADLIIGHGPHVLQPIEVLHVNMPEYVNENTYVEDVKDPAPRTSLVAYSLGNFTTAMDPLPCRIGGLLTVKLKRETHYDTNEKRCIISDGSLDLIYAAQKGMNLTGKTVRLEDVSFCLSLENEDDLLKVQAREAVRSIQGGHVSSTWIKSIPFDFKQPAKPQRLSNRQETTQ